MWRTQAVRSMLLEDIGGLPPDDPEALTRARRRALVMVALDWAAILVLVLLHDGVGSQLAIAGEQTLFTLGILAVATHSGFRLAQLHKLRAIARVCEELEERRSE
jgi:hypothetical protein